MFRVEADKLHARNMFCEDLACLQNQIIRDKLSHIHKNKVWEEMSNFGGGDSFYLKLFIFHFFHIHIKCNRSLFLEGQTFYLQREHTHEHTRPAERCSIQEAMGRVKG
jgi:hypothetical protein